MNDNKENEFELPSSLKEENVILEQEEQKPVADLTFNPAESLVKTTDFSSNKVFMDSIKEATGEEVKVEEVKIDNKSKYMTIFTYITIAVVCFTLGGAFGYCIGAKAKEDNKTTINTEEKQEEQTKTEE